LRKDSENNSNASGYSSAASVDSAIDGQGHHFARKWKNWTGFTINEVDYSENEQNTLVKGRQDNDKKREGKACTSNEDEQVATYLSNCKMIRQYCSVK